MADNWLDRVFAVHGNKALLYWHSGDKGVPKPLEDAEGCTEYYVERDLTPKEYVLCKARVLALQGLIDGREWRNPQVPPRRLPEVEMLGGLLLVVGALCLLGFVLLAIAKGWLT